MREQSSGSSPVGNTADGGSAKAVLVVVCIALFFAELEASAVSVILPEISIGISVDIAPIG